MIGQNENLFVCEFFPHFSHFGIFPYNKAKKKPFFTIIVGRVLRLRRNTDWQDYVRFDSLLSRAALGHLGKGWIVRGTTTTRLPFWVQKALLPELEQVVPSYSLTVAVLPTARH